MLSSLKDPGLAGASVLVTGGTGSFGRQFVRAALRLQPAISRIVVFSRDEMKQFEMSRLPELQDDRVRFFLGDVRDQSRLARALEGVDVVIHAAALKQVPAAEYNPFEFVKTNILGAQNVIECALDAGVQRVVALSTDKAAAPINLYGATKLCSDKLFVAANHFRGKRDIRMSVVRYGNVLGSRGSVVPFFLEQRGRGVVPITDPRMTRFNITLEEGVNFVFNALSVMRGGEIFVPRLPSYRILDLAEAVAPDCRIDVVGVRPGEKLHEEMITSTDSLRCLGFPSHFVMLPSMQLWDEARYATELGGSLVEPGFRYDSENNKEWLSVDAIRALVRRHIDPAFEPSAKRG